MQKAHVAFLSDASFCTTKDNALNVTILHTDVRTRSVGLIAWLSGTATSPGITFVLDMLIIQVFTGTWLISAAAQDTEGH